MDAVALKISRHRKKKDNNYNKSVCMISMHYIRVNQRKRIGERLNVQTVFKTKYVLLNFFRKMKLNTDMLDISQCIYRIPSECGREYLDVTSRPLNIRIGRYKCNLREGHFDKSKLAVYASKEEHRCDTISTTILEFLRNSVCM